MTEQQTSKLHRLPEEMRNLAYERAGGTGGQSNYDPDLLATLTTAADEIEQLRVELERRLALLSAMSYRVLIPSLPNCKHINHKAWVKALEGFDITELGSKHEAWVREQMEALREGEL